MLVVSSASLRSAGTDSAVPISASTSHAASTVPSAFAASSFRTAGSAAAPAFTSAFFASSRSALFSNRAAVASASNGAISPAGTSTFFVSKLLSTHRCTGWPTTYRPTSATPDSTNHNGRSPYPATGRTSCTRQTGGSRVSSPPAHDPPRPLRYARHSTPKAAIAPPITATYEIHPADCHTPSTHAPSPTSVPVTQPMMA